MARQQKTASTKAPQHTGAEMTNPHGLGTRLFCGSRATNFSIHTTKMEGDGPQILGTGVKFKRVPCQTSCRVNRAERCSISVCFHRKKLPQNLPFGFTVVKNTTVCKISEIQSTSIPDAERCNCCPLFITFKIPYIYFSPLVLFIELTFQY